MQIIQHDFTRPTDPDVAKRLGLSFADLRFGAFQPAIIIKGPAHTPSMWTTASKKALRKAGIKCGVCQQPISFCSHFTNADFQINRFNNEIRLFQAHPKKKKKSCKLARKRKNNRLRHSKQKTHKPTLAECRQIQIDNPTKAGNRFAELCRMAWPNRKVLREEIRGFYIMDFYFPAVNLCIEIDGPVHGIKKQIAHDKRRTDYFKRVHGVRVIRFTNEQVLKYPELVIESLSEFLTDKQRKRSDPGNHDSTRRVCPGGPDGVHSSTVVLSSLGA